MEDKAETFLSLNQEHVVDKKYRSFSSMDEWMILDHVYLFWFALK